MPKILRTLAAAVLCAASLMTAGSADGMPNAAAAVASAAVAKDNSAAVNPVCINVKAKSVISKDTVVKENETLYVRSGGKLYINEGVTLTVKGKLRCADGGEIYCRGQIDSEENSRVSVYGKLKLLSTAELSLGGKLAVYPTGTVVGNGKIRVENLFSDIYCRGTVTAKIAAPAPVKENGVTSVGGIIIANKQYDLPADYGDGLKQNAYSAFLVMKKASGYDMKLLSGYRSYEKQREVFAYWCSVDGEEKAKTYSALPGQSEHQTGLAIDISSLSQDYGKTAEGKWLAQNCWKYGFIIRYPKGKENITGYIYEPWHVRYLGISTAKLVYDSKLTLEEFLGLA